MLPLPRPVFLLLLVLAKTASASPETAQPSPAYLAGCRFIERLDAWATGFAEARGARPQEKLPLAIEGANAYRHTEEGLRLDYLVTGHGRTLVSSLTLRSPYLDKLELNARIVAQQLLLPQALPAELKLGCDRIELTAESHGGQLISLSISSPID